MIRIPFLITCAFVGFLATPFVRAENLLQNPGFESGALSPGWAGSALASVVNAVGTFSEGNFGASLAANIAVPGSPTTLSQTFATVAGTTYLLKFDFSNASGGGLPGFPGGTASASVQLVGAAVTPLATQFLPSTSAGFQSKLLLFTADSTSTTLTVSFSNIVGIGSLLVDNFQVAKASFGRSGKYAGSVRVTTMLPDREISSAHLLKVVARIDSAGRMDLITQPDGGIYQGVITDDKSVSLSLVTVGPATAAIIGNPPTIKFSFQQQVIPVLATLTSEDTVIKYDFVIRRVGK